jgi:hypothetical protein
MRPHFAAPESRDAVHRQREKSMRKARVLAVAAAIGLSLAAPAPLFAADGLGQFQEMLRQAPHGVLSYERGQALGDDGFILENVTVTPPPAATEGMAAEGVKTEPIHIDRIAVEDFDFASYHKNEPPNFAKLHAEGIAIDTKSFDAFDLRELTGLGTILADFRLDYRVDPERKTMMLNRLELDLHELARIELSLVLDGIDPDDREAAAASASLRTASLVFEDRSLLGTALPSAAKTRGIDPEKIAKLAGAMLDSLRPGTQGAQGTAVTAALDVLAAYVDDYTHPKGPLRITLNPPAKLPLAAVAAIKDPEEAVRMLGLTVSYAGARPRDAEKPDAEKPETPAR